MGIVLFTSDDWKQTQLRRRRSQPFAAKNGHRYFIVERSTFFHTELRIECTQRPARTAWQEEGRHFPSAERSLMNKTSWELPQCSSTPRWINQQQLQGVCLAFGAGFDDAELIVENPFRPESLEADAWNFGRRHRQGYLEGE
jgi:hypothetical protein